MTIKIWEVKDGKITSLKHTNIRGENRLVILKESIDYDNSAIISDLGKALDLVNDRVASVEKIKDDIIDTTVDTKIDTTVDTKIDTKVDTIVDTKIDTKVDTIVDTKIDTKVDTTVDKYNKEVIEPIVSQKGEEIHESTKSPDADNTSITGIDELPKNKDLDEKLIHHPNIGKEEDKNEIRMRDDNVLSKEDIEKELSQIEKKYGLSPEEFYKAWKEGKIHGNEAMKLATYYEMYVEDYGPYTTKEKDTKDNEDGEWPWPTEDSAGDNDKKRVEVDIPHEVKDKLDALLQIDNKGQRDAVQYLIQKYAKNRNDTKPSRGVHGDAKGSETKNDHGLSLIPKEDVAKIGRARGKAREKGEPYKMYDVAVNRFIPDILEKIEISKDKMIRVRISDMAKQLGEEFVNKKPVTIYSGLKYTLFDHNIIVEMGRLKEVDETGENIRVLKMRMRNPEDKLPSSLSQRKKI